MTHQLFQLVKRSTRLAALICGMAVFMLGNVIIILAQDGATPQRGFAPGGSFALSNIESVNATNGNVILKVPLAQLPAGRAAFSAKLNLYYNSKLYDTSVAYVINTHQLQPCDPAKETTNFCDPFTKIEYIQQNVINASDQGGWHYGLTYSLQLSQRTIFSPSSNGSPQCPSQQAIYQYKLKVAYPDGSLHEFVPASGTAGLNDGYYNVRADGFIQDCAGGHYNPNATVTTFYSLDGTYTRLDIARDSDQNPNNNPWTLYLPDGTRVTSGNPNQRIYDRNNNYVEFQNITNYNGTGNPATRIIDQEGRTIDLEYGGAAGDLIHTTAFGNPASFSGGPLTTTVTWENIRVNQTYNANIDPGAQPGSPWQVNFGHTFGVVSQITLPNVTGTSAIYTFNYNAPIFGASATSSTSGWGEISSIILPSGAHSSYSYRQDQGGGDYTDILNNSLIQKNLTYQLEYDCPAGAPCASLSPGTLPTTTETTSYSISTTAGVTLITAPDGGTTREDFGVGSSLTLKTTRPNGSVTEKLWMQNPPGGSPQAVSHGLGGSPNLNTFVKTEFSSITNGNGVLTLTAIKDYAYDQNGNVLRISEYDWMPYTNVLRDSNNYPTGIPSGATPLKVTVNTYTNSPSGLGSDPNLYANPNSPQFRSALASSEIQSGGGQTLSRTELVYDSATTTANVIQQRNWDSKKGPLPMTASNSISTYHQYSPSGNPTLHTDPLGIQTKLTYDSSDLYLTESQAAFGTSVERDTSFQYDFNTGIVCLTTDMNNGISTKSNYDGYDRPVMVQDGYGTAAEKQTATAYDDSHRVVYSLSDLNATHDEMLVKIVSYDPMGRPRLTRQIEDRTVGGNFTTDETGGIKTQIRYMYSGGFAYKLTSNPYRASSSTAASSEPTMGWTRTKTDSVGRVVEIQTFDGTGLPAPWGNNTNSTGTVTTTYDANVTTVTDQAGRTRSSVTDGLGRLIQINEDPGGLNLQTTYTYDAMGNNLSVNQGVNQGGQTRTSIFSSLGRLISTTNPESGTVAFTYNDDGDLLTKTDARSIVTTMTYDEQHRMKTKSYSDGTPTVSQYYDNQALPFAPAAFNRGAYPYGKIIAVTLNGANLGSFYSYDQLGQITSRFQRTDGVDYGPLTINHNIAGEPTATTYPSGRTITQSYDNDARLKSLASGGVTFTSGLTYNSAGSLLSETYGNNLVHTISYNSRLQPTEISLGSVSAPKATLDLNYSYGGGFGATDILTHDNGNVLGITGNVASQAIPQKYTYDSLNRLSTATETNAAGTSTVWQQNYGYDAFGNRAIVSGGSSGGSTPTTATGSVTLYGSVASQQVCDDWEYNESGFLYCADYATTYDSGTVGFTVGGFTANYSYWQGDTVGTILAGLANTCNTSTSSPVTATVSGNVITLTSKVAGSSGNYSLTASAQSDNNWGSFGVTASGSTLTGGSGGSGGSSGTPDLTFNNKNQVVGYVYDNSGNLLADGHHTYTYDAENRLISIDNGAELYVYDGEGHRVKKTPQENIRMIYGLGAALIAEYDAGNNSLKKEYIYGVGGLLATIDSSCGTEYLTSDHLGTPRVLTSASGIVNSWHDYMPFGEQIGSTVGARASIPQYGGADCVRQKYTSKERDAESGLDYFGSRYYSSSSGRFTSPDSLGGQAANPQSFNLYVYVHNNPLALVDPTGHSADDPLDEDSEVDNTDGTDSQAPDGPTTLTWTTFTPYGFAHPVLLANPITINFPKEIVDALNTLSRNNYEIEYNLTLVGITNARNPTDLVQTSTLSTATTSSTLSTDLTLSAGVEGKAGLGLQLADASVHGEAALKTGYSYNWLSSFAGGQTFNVATTGPAQRDAEIMEAKNNHEAVGILQRTQVELPIVSIVNGKATVTGTTTGYLPKETIDSIIKYTNSVALKKASTDAADNVAQISRP